MKDRLQLYQTLIKLCYSNKFDVGGGRLPNIKKATSEEIAFFEKEKNLTRSGSTAQRAVSLNGPGLCL